MQKLHNIIISILVAICIMFNIFNVRAYAMAPGAGLVVSGLGAAASGAAGAALTSLRNNNSDFSSFYGSQSGLVLQDNLHGFGQRNDLIEIQKEESGEVTAYVTNAECTAAEREIAAEIVNNFNNDPNRGRYVTEVGNALQITASGYEHLKKYYTTSMLMRAQRHYADYSIQNGNENIENLDFAYSFSFEDYLINKSPSASLVVPETVKNRGYTVIDGYRFSYPISAYTTGNTAFIYDFFDSIQNPSLVGSSPGYIGDIAGKYYGVYVQLSDGTIYYGKATNKGQLREGILSISTSDLNIFNQWVELFDENGRHCPYANQYGTVRPSDLGAIAVGFYVNQTSDSLYPSSGTMSGDTFSETEGGDMSIPIAFTPPEKTVAEALGLGLISPEAPIVLDDSGSIVSAGDIPIDELARIVQGMKNGKYEGEIKDAVGLLVSLVSQGNLSREQQRLILQGFEQKFSSVPGTLTEIRDILKEMDKESADPVAIPIEIAAPKSFDIRTPDSIIDKFPFSLPFDVYSVYNLLSAEPEAPVFTIPLKMEGVFEYSINIDLSEYDNIASIARWFLYIIFVIGLILATNKLIGRG